MWEGVRVCVCVWGGGTCEGVCVGGGGGRYLRGCVCGGGGVYVRVYMCRWSVQTATPPVRAHHSRQQTEGTESSQHADLQ